MRKNTLGTTSNILCIKFKGGYMAAINYYIIVICNILHVYCVTMCPIWPYQFPLKYLLVECGICFN